MVKKHIDMFTKEQYQVLIGMQEAQRIIPTGTMPICIETIIWGIWKGSHLSRRSTLKFLRKPLSEMPLYINDTDDLIRIIALWRLKIGRNMNSFTRQEIGYLCQLLKSEGWLISSYFYTRDDTGRSIIQTPEIINENLRADSTKPCSITIHKDVTCEDLREAIFDKPLEDMPLLINEDLLKTVAKCRMRIAK